MNTHILPRPALRTEVEGCQHYNGLTPAQAERLALLAEECGEVVHAIGKVLRHGYERRQEIDGLTHREVLERECGDVYHCIWRIIAAGDIDGERMSNHADNMARNVEKFLHHAG